MDLQHLLLHKTFIEWFGLMNTDVDDEYFVSIKKKGLI